jgi:hypothetical protein
MHLNWDWIAENILGLLSATGSLVAAGAAAWGVGQNRKQLALQREALANTAIPTVWTETKGTMEGWHCVVLMVTAKTHPVRIKSVRAKRPRKARLAPFPFSRLNSKGAREAFVEADRANARSTFACERTAYPGRTETIAFWFHCPKPFRDRLWPSRRDTRAWISASMFLMDRTATPLDMAVTVVAKASTMIEKP